jgi:outer membrane protein OmpA-like peptidoglycan-associated protein
MRKIITTTLLLAFLLLPSISLFAQKAEKITPKKAMFYLEDGNWEKAKQIYLELLKDSPDDQELNLYCGVAFLNSRINADKSMDHFNKVDESTTPGVILLKGESFHYMGQFDSAKVYYDKYKNTDGVKIEKGLVKLMDQRMVQCNDGITFTNSPIAGMFVENLGPDVNTMFLDYAPVVYEDLKTLVFTSTNFNLFNIKYMTFQAKGQEEIFYTNYDPVYKKWLPREIADGVVLNKQIESDDNESSIAFSSDLSKFYFYRTGKLYVSTNLGDPVVHEISHPSFTDKQIVSLSINRAEDHIFITSDRGGAMFSTDIYESIKTDSGTWSSFKAIDGINTSYDEGSPFISEDGTKLYFASKGYNSIGDYDIFVATKSDTGWGDVKNMGVPVNSPANDIHFRLTGGSEEFGYLASDRMGGSGDYDIWRVWTCHDIPSTNLAGKFVELSGAPIDSATLTLMNIDSSVVATVDPLANNSNYSFTVNTETSYILSLDVKGRAIHTYNITIPEQCSEYDIFQTLTCELKMDPDSFVFEQKSVLTNAFYDIDAAKGEDTREAFLAGLSADSPMYTDPESRVTPWEKDELMAELPTPVKNADGKFVHLIYFDFDKSFISDEDRDYITKVSKILNADPSKKVILNGHTDSQGSASYNKPLSNRRAKRVADYFIKNGVNPAQIETVGYGESQLAIKDTDSQGRWIISKTWQNRRCEVEIK